MKTNLSCVAASVNGVAVAVIVLLFWYHKILPYDGPSIHGLRSSTDQVHHLDYQNTASSSSAVELLGAVKDRVQTCLTATGMKTYLQQNGLLDYALTSATHYTRAVQRLMPERFLTKFPNHCWRVNITYQVDRSKSGSVEIHGQYDTIAYRGRPINTRYSPSNDFLSMACMPEVFLAGFSKCGSTYLYSLLIQHPLIIEPQLKEPHWWILPNHFTENASNDAFFFAEYVSMYKPLVKKLQRPHDSFRLLTIDASPKKMYRWPRFARDENLAVNYCLIPAVLPELLPRAKLLVVMRNPTDMLYSAFWFSCFLAGYNLPMSIQLKGPDIFHERIVGKINAFKACTTQFPLMKCVIDMTPDIYSSELPCGRSRLEMGMYYVHVHKWLSVVPRNRFMFLTLEELSADTNGVMGEVWNFLGLPHMVPPTQKVRNQQVKVDYHHDPRLFMRKDTRELLNDFFAPYNQMLADLLGDDKFLWTT